MWVNSSFLLLFSSIVSTFGVNVSSETFRMLIAFSTNDDRPTSFLIPHLCWTSYELKSLAKSLSDAGMTVATSLQPNRSETLLHHVLILADLACPDSATDLVKASSEGYMKSPYRWLLLAKEGQHLDILDQLDLPVNSDVVVAKRRGNEVEFIEVYKIAPNWDVISTTRSIWRPTNNNDNIHDTNISNDPLATSRSNVIVRSTEYGVIEDYRRTKVLSARRKDLRGLTLTMANVLAESNDTQYHLDDRLNLDDDSMTKIAYAPVKVCLQMLNVTERRIFTHTWGYRDNDGKWQGVIELILKKEADLGTIMMFTQSRAEAVEFIAMVAATSIQLLYREPPLAYMSNIFALPFSTTVWQASIVCVFGCSLFLYIVCKYEASSPGNASQLNGSWTDVFILAVGAVLQQGCTLEPRFTAGKGVTFVLFLSLTVLYAAYTANIVVLLRAPSSSIRTLSDLLNSPLELGASDFPYNHYFFKKLNDPIRKAIYDKKIAPKGQKPHFYTMKEGIAKLRKGMFGFHMELNPGYRIIQETFLESEKCDLVVMDYINEMDPWLPAQKRGVYNEMFKVNFNKIRETGIQACLHARLVVPKPKCSGPVSTFSSVGITDMTPAMLATLYVFLFAIGIFLVELVYHKMTTIRKDGKSRNLPTSRQKKVLKNNYLP